MIGKWDRWYYGLAKPEPFNNTASYRLGGEFLADCLMVEDWGAGKGWFRQFIRPERYRGVDGSNTPYAEVRADLTEYRSQVAGVFIRHVLEHNYEWRRILDNALASAQEKLFIVLFTPLRRQTQVIAYADDPGVPDISFGLADIVRPIERAGFTWTLERLENDTQYGEETLIRATRV